VSDPDDDGTLDVFVRDRQTGVTKRISESPWYSDGPMISADGRFVSYYSHQAYTRVHKWVFDRVIGWTVQVDVDPAGVGTHLNSSRDVVIAPGGRHAVFETGAALLPQATAVQNIFLVGCPVFQSPGEPDADVCAPDAFPLGSADRARFDAGLDEFANVDTIANGLGPVFNEASCAACHNRPYVGGSGTRPVGRFATTGPGGFDPLTGLGGLVLQSQGIDTGTCAVAGEIVPPAATIVTQRDTPALFGLGLVELIAEDKILRFADPADVNQDGVSGRPNMVGGRIGRFGRKASIATLREFAGDAYLNEMGITSPDFPNEIRPQGSTPLCDTVADPEDDGSNVTAFTDFLSFLQPLPANRWPSPEVKRRGRAGLRVFKRIGCASCHTDKLRTGFSPVLAMARKKVPMFSDLLLHDMGPGLADGIEEGQATGSEFRTAPLWGVVWSAPYLHDGRAATIEEAITLHGGEAQRARDGFVSLTEADKAALLTFLRSL
jgi:mono/diheme cytochrome c family protein